MGYHPKRSPLEALLCVCERCNRFLVGCQRSTLWTLELQDKIDYYDVVDELNVEEGVGIMEIQTRITVRYLFHPQNIDEFCAQLQSHVKHCKHVHFTCVEMAGGTLYSISCDSPQMPYVNLYKSSSVT